MSTDARQEYALAQLAYTDARNRLRQARKAEYRHWHHRIATPDFPDQKLSLERMAILNQWIHRLSPLARRLLMLRLAGCSWTRATRILQLPRLVATRIQRELATSFPS